MARAARSALVAACVLTASPGQAGFRLLSLVDLPIPQGGRLVGFALGVAGVRVLAVCGLPLGWNITAGMEKAQVGAIVGQSYTSDTGLTEASPEGLRELALVHLNDDEDVAADLDRGEVLPVTFTGTLDIVGAEGERSSREVPLTQAMIRLSDGGQCPPIRGE